MVMYRRLAALGSLEDVDEMRAELRDRFGAPPNPVKRLLSVMEVRVYGLEAGAKALIASRDRLTVVYEHAQSLDPGMQARLKRAFGHEARFSLENQQPALLWDFAPDADLLNESLRLLKTLAQISQE
jgi:transcription-repair coupling factor (superfamily II helicase)